MLQMHVLYNDKSITTNTRLHVEESWFLSTLGISNKSNLIFDVIFTFGNSYISLLTVFDKIVRRGDDGHEH